MTSLLFDSGPIISLAMNNLLWILEPLKRKTGGNFTITGAVKRELVERPLTIKKFEFEAIQVAKLIENGVLEITADKSKKSKLLADVANSCFECKGQQLRIVQDAEIEILAIASETGNAAVIDERTVRLLVEDAEDLRTLLEKRLHSDVKMNSRNVRRFQKELGSVHIIRSSELVGVAFALGLFDELVPRMKRGREVLLDAVLWGVKSDGCAITENEIEEIKKALLQKSA